MAADNMEILEFAGEVIVLSTSGVLSPGPLFLANLIYGSKQGYYAGIKIANGHMIAELFLIILLSFSLFGLSSFTAGPVALRMVGMIGGIAIIFFAAAQILNMTRRVGYNTDLINKSNKNKKQDIGYASNYFLLLDKISRRVNLGQLMVGMIFTAMNPFFVIWWLTVGIKLISDSINLFGIIEGILVLFLFHVWMDYAWLTLTAYLISKGWSIAKMRSYGLFLIFINAILISYGFYFLVTNVI
ncbi:MAG TPA: LysE family transporter [Nitrososphaeraceae archaeon]|nr:LysE family transporter [Nitrososphaeraceae archaeon]